MCRFVAYLGKTPALLKHVLDAPENSLIIQSKAARKGPSRLNADGFGIGWYQKDIEENPGTFKSTLPAWNDQNLLSIASKIESKCFCGHVRASTIGGVNYENCHPFAFNQYMFMHNGSIFGFEKIRQQLSSELHDTYFDQIKGRTDSEYFFALLMDRLHHLPKENSNLDLMDKAMRQAIQKINTLQKPFKKDDHARINTVLTNGSEMLVTRYTSGDPNDVLPVFFTLGDQWDAHTKYSTMLPIKDKPQALLIATEPLTENIKGWHEIPANHMLKINQALEYTISPI
jgi:predicted glutamine amidotransferase